MKIRFIGALGTVTGSCTLFTHRRRYYLVDCGATQGNDAIDGGPECKLPFKASGIDGVFLTHAHLDHCGMLPELVKQGFRGHVYCTRATADLTRLALTDAASLPTAQFSAKDVERLRFVYLDERPGFQFGKFFGLDANLSVALIRTSHILGSVGFEFQFAGSPDGKPSSRKTIVFSGDIGCNVDGNCYQSLLDSRQYPSTHAEYLVCESTYGGRNREVRFTSFEERMQSLKTAVLEAAARSPGATLIFPCFTMQRMQDLQLDLHCLFEKHLDEIELRQLISANNGLPEVIIDSPLSRKYGEVFSRELLRMRANGKFSYLNPELAGRLNLDSENLAGLLARLFGKDQQLTSFHNYTLGFGAPSQPKHEGLRIILAGSGMCTGGRIMEHLRRWLPFENTTVVITGYQGGGTPGAELTKRAANPSAAIDGTAWGMAGHNIKARVVNLSGFFSGHADHAGLLDFIQTKNSSHPYLPLKRVFLVHGDNQARQDLRRAIEHRTDSGHASKRQVERVELPNPENRWFDLVKNTMVWEYHPQVELAEQAVQSGFGRLQKLEGMILEFCQKGTDGKAVTEMIDQLNLAKLHLASARQTHAIGR
jgi:metallo-beta-lactamase family protein